MQVKKPLLGKNKVWEGLLHDSSRNDEHQRGNVRYHKEKDIPHQQRLHAREVGAKADDSSCKTLICRRRNRERKQKNWSIAHFM